ncbi:carotenoid-cleaving dioxygenase, mitochondrial-like [Penaeus indicus]|uniref:carotenoid-cleaving dioxygenase, mitochondrial-like n=1 Tax=Penaeus indicus TaxID=29960 RepID=UPI00300D2605
MATQEAPCVWTRHCQQETADPVEGQVTGTLPKWLEGRVTRNGPGKLQVGDTPYRHLFDALAMLHQFHIANSRVTYRSRFLKSDSFKKNMTANRIVVTEFGTAAYPDPCMTLFKRFKNTFTVPTTKKMTDNCLVNVCQVRDEMFALTETCYIHKVDPENLETLGDKIMLTKYVAVNMATAHPHIEDGTVYNMGSSFSSAKGPCYNVIKMSEGSLERAKVVASISCQWRLYPSYYHSFAMTERYWVLVEQPLVMSACKLVKGAFANRPPFDALKWLPEKKVKFRVIERATGNLVQTLYTADAFVTFHHVNAWESQGHLVLDLCATDDGEVVKMLCISNLEKNPSDTSRILFRSYLRRYVLPMAGVSKATPGENLAKLEGFACKATKQEDGSVHCTYHSLYSEFFDMPRINYKMNGKPYRYAYGVSTKGNDLIFEMLIKVDVMTGQTWKFASENFVVAEPIFVEVPDATDEDHGVILSTLLRKNDPRYVALLVLSARDMSEIARAEFEANDVVTSTFHGQFVAAHESSHTY